MCYALRLSSSSDSSIYLANPKSQRQTEQSSLAKIFEGLISRCNI